MSTNFLLDCLRRRENDVALICQDQEYRAGEIIHRFEQNLALLATAGVSPGTVVMLEGDFSVHAVSMFLALLHRRCIIVPLAEDLTARRQERATVAQVQVHLSNVGNSAWRCSCDAAVRPDHPHYQELRRRDHPGIVLFSSGSSGQPKASVSDLHAWLQKFRIERPALRTLAFLLFDHVGGVNTLLACLAYGSTMVMAAERSPDAVLAAIARYRVQLLPTSPTFLNLILLSEAYQRWDVSSLELITYGTEPMPETTLQRVRKIFPWVRLKQTYGLSEVGILRSKSRSSDSLWVKVGGEGYETRVVDGMLEIRSPSAMIGYLNAPSPFTSDGWLKTGDRVEIDGEYIRFCGRDSELINVGGQKVFPAEIENVLLELPEIAEVIVFGKQHSIVGAVVCARIRPRAADEDPHRLVRLAKRHCARRLERFKVPVHIECTNEPLHSQRFKKASPYSCPSTK